MVCLPISCPRQDCSGRGRAVRGGPFVREGVPNIVGERGRREGTRAVARPQSRAGPLPTARSAAGGHGRSAELRGWSAGRPAQRAQREAPLHFAHRLGACGNSGGRVLYQPGEIGGLVTRVANGTLPLASMLPVPGSRRDADQQHQRDDDSRQQAETDSRGDVPKLTHETGSLLPRGSGRVRPTPPTVTGAARSWSPATGPG